MTQQLQKSKLKCRDLGILSTASLLGLRIAHIYLVSTHPQLESDAKMSLYSYDSLFCLLAFLSAFSFWRMRTMPLYFSLFSCLLCMLLMLDLFLDKAIKTGFNLILNPLTVVSFIWLFGCLWQAITLRTKEVLLEKTRQQHQQRQSLALGILGAYPYGVGTGSGAASQRPRNSSSVRVHGSGQMYDSGNGTGNPSAIFHVTADNPVYSANSASRSNNSSAVDQSTRNSSRPEGSTTEGRGEENSV